MTDPNASPLVIYAGKSSMPSLRGILRDIRPIWLMEEIGAPYAIKWIALADDDHRGAAYRAINPLARVPGLRDGDFTMFESAAMCVYLGDKFGRFVPAPGTHERVKLDQWLFAAMSTIEPQSARIFTCDFMMPQDETTASVRAAAVKTLEELLAGLDSALAEREALVDGGFSVADIIMCAVLRFVHHSDLLASFPNVAAYVARSFARPAFQRAFTISTGEVQQVDVQQAS